jgi:hypothetical protein
MTEPEGPENPPNQKMSNEPIYVRGGVEGEPVKYLGIKPYDLDKYQFSILRKSFDNKSILFNATLGGTVGGIVIVISKLIQLAIDQKPLNLEYYEIIAICLGGLVAIVFWLLRKYKISEEEKEKKELIENIASWFERNPNRNIHVTPKEEMKK